MFHSRQVFSGILYDDIEEEVNRDSKLSNDIKGEVNGEFKLSNDREIETVMKQLRLSGRYKSRSGTECSNLFYFVTGFALTF